MVYLQDKPMTITKGFGLRSQVKIFSISNTLYFNISFSLMSIFELQLIIQKLMWLIKEALRKTVLFVGHGFCKKQTNKDI